MRFQNKIALVTGAASGIGQAVTELLEAEGALVIAADIAFDKDTTVARPHRATISLDVTNEDNWIDVLSRVKGLDVLVACAGISTAGPLMETTLEDWRRVMSVNVDGAFLALRHCLPLMKTGASCVLIGSASGTKAAAGATAYSTSKAALKMLAKSAALEVKPLGIRVNSVAPAGVVTPMWTKMPFWNDLIATHGSEAAAWKALGGADPETPSIQRMALPAEVARAVLFLASDDAAHVTGSELVIDGGYTA
jgi:NAD(P)-dependent dehydrogenase (short-subunit alcohol dehydrogenase family)